MDDPLHGGRGPTNSGKAPPPFRAMPERKRFFFSEVFPNVIFMIVIVKMLIDGVQLAAQSVLFMWKEYERVISHKGLSLHGGQRGKLKQLQDLVTINAFNIFVKKLVESKSGQMVFEKVRCQLGNLSW